MCNDLFREASGKMDCPIRMFPKCHPRAHIEVFIDVRHRSFILCCGQCDRPVTTVVAKTGKDNHGRKTK